MCSKCLGDSSIQNNLDKPSGGDDIHAIKAASSKIVTSATVQEKPAVVQSPIQSTKSPILNMQGTPDDSQSLQNSGDLQQLMAQLEKLRNDNRRLKDEERLRENSSTAVPRNSDIVTRMVENSSAASLPPILYLVVMLILGIVLGKFFM